MLSRLSRSAQQPSSHVLGAFALLFLLLFAAGAAAAPGGGKGGGKPKSTSSTPTISIVSPTSGSTVSGSVTVSGSASDSSASLASVQVSVDGGAFQTASGTSSWSFPLSTGSYPDGTHTIAARAADSKGNTVVTTTSVMFSNSPTSTTPLPDTTPPSVSISAPAPNSTVAGTVSVSGSASDNVGVSTVQVSVDDGAYQAAQGTSAWSYSVDTTTLANGSHTLSARATDTSGNVSTTSESITVQNTTTQGLSPGVVQQLVTPEGATINIYSDAVGWTAQQIYDLLKPNAYQLNVIGPALTIDVTAQYASQTSTSASSSNGVWGNYHATMTLQANGTSAFAARPDAVAAHEYGHAWTNYYYYVRWQRDWTPWLQVRGLVGNPLLGSSYQWTTREMIADDYRLLFGTSAAQSEMAYINPAIADPRTVAGLKDWFVNTWA